MATAPITHGDLIARFPEMAEANLTAAQAVLSEVHERIGDHWPEELRARAQLYLAAHILVIEGGANRSASGATTGAVAGRKEGDVEVRFGPVGGGVVAYQQGKNYTATPYGRRFDELQKAAFGGAVFAV